MHVRQVDVVIVGAGLTGLTAAFYLKQRGKNVLLLERSNRTGGQIHTYQKDGFTYESGPNTGVISYPEVAELFAALTPDCKLQTAREEAKRRYIWKGDHFRELPSGLFSALFTPLFSFTDKFRILGEPFRAKGTDPDESVGELARRRLGKSYLNYAVDPFLSGVYAGDPMKLVTRYALPKLYNLEQQYGGFIRGTIAKAKLPKTDRDRLATKQVFSAEGGLGELSAALTKRIGEDHIILSAADIQIKPGNTGWEVVYADENGNQRIQADKIITTVGAYSLPALLPFILKEDIQKISNLKYAPIVQVSVGIKDTGKLQFNGFGGLVPSCEKKNVLGILYPSACFPGRAPEKGALFSFFIGGVNHKDLTELTDGELKALIERELHDMLKFPKGTKPDMLHIFRHPRAIPQYELNSGERFKTIETIERLYPGLHLAGNIKGGIGMADRIRQGTELGKL
ncbi:protoporphyrinogen oxidase [Massilibacteroides sp.]|uniref:protoporphyrinogen oxidase n=1 Tax=Massilibacteroides sp. TaxID=2034766 RepID=UPI002604E636|nr:protoporphyrinogen oxidase [Massilibacteroides sp.]MDD4514990.1 protoporphyrinogen oxidase [Massilibacteroides sp.]